MGVWVGGRKITGVRGTDKMAHTPQLCQIDINEAVIAISGPTTLLGHSIGTIFSVMILHG